MNKSALCLSVCISALIFGAGVQEAEAQTSRLYLAGYMGLNLYDDQSFDDNTAGIQGSADLDNALSFAGALGLRLSRNTRIEAEISYRKADVSAYDTNVGSIDGAGEVENYMGLINLYYDFDVRWDVQPYVSIGAGYGLFEGEFGSGAITPTSEDAGALAYQAGAGIKYRTRSNVAFTAGYRYLDALDLDFDGFELDYDSHEIRVGVEYDLDWR